MLSHAGEKPFACKKCKNSCRQSHDLKTHMKTHFYFKMLITFEPNVAQRSVASQNDHKSKACLPEASNTAFTMYRRLFFWRLTALLLMPIVWHRSISRLIFCAKVQRKKTKMSLFPSTTCTFQQARKKCRRKSCSQTRCSWTWWPWRGPSKACPTRRCPSTRTCALSCCWDTSCRLLPIVSKVFNLSLGSHSPE